MESLSQLLIYSIEGVQRWCKRIAVRKCWDGCALEKIKQKSDHHPYIYSSCRLPSLSVSFTFTVGEFGQSLQLPWLVTFTFARE
jgi:hypothetical protein